MTAGAMLQDKKRCLEAGMDDYIVKPVNPAKLVQLLKRWLTDEYSQYNSAPPPENHFSHTWQTENRADGVLYENPVVFNRCSLMERLMNDEELIIKLMRMAFQNFPLRINALKTALKANDPKAAYLQLHTIKGMTANISAEALSALTSELEKAAETGDLETVSKRIGEMEAAFKVLRKSAEKAL